MQKTLNLDQGKTDENQWRKAKGAKDKYTMPASCQKIGCFS
jgi:hypothetical protein